MSDTKFKL